MQINSANHGVGSMVVFPAAVIGFFALTDGTGPQGWRGFAEPFGWLATCMIMARFLVFLLMRASQGGVRNDALAFAGVAGIGVLAYELLNWLGRDAPMSAKALLTSSMQALGVVGAVLRVLSIARTVWKLICRSCPQLSGCVITTTGQVKHPRPDKAPRGAKRRGALIHHIRSNRSRFITFVPALTNAPTNAACASSAA